MNGLRKHCTANHSTWYGYQTQVRITCEIRLDHHLRARTHTLSMELNLDLSFQGYSV